MKKNQGELNNGFSIIEVLLAVSLFGLMVAALTGIYFYGQEASALSGKRNRAVALAEEGMEAVRNLRDANYSSLTDGTYGLGKSGSAWTLVPSPDTTGIYSRSININSVDANHKEISSTVTWQQNVARAGSVTLTSKLDYWMRVVNTADWSKPLLSGSLNLAGNNDGYKLQVKGNYVYMIRNGGTPNFFIIDISNPASPVLAGSLALSGTLRNLYSDGSYAYVVSNSDTQELQIVDVSNPALPVISGTYNAAGTSDANGVYVIGNYAYMVKVSSTSPEFFVVDITNPALPTLTGSLDLGATAYEVVASGGFAYVASGSNTQELQVVNITNPASPSIGATLNLASNNDARNLSMYNNVTILVTQSNTFYTVDINNPLAPSVLGSINLGVAINDTALESNTSQKYAYVATSDTLNEFKVIDLASFASPVLYGEYDQTGNNVLNGVAYEPGIDKAMAASNANAQEFIILEP